MEIFQCHGHKEIEDIPKNLFDKIVGEENSQNEAIVPWLYEDEERAL